VTRRTHTTGLTLGKFAPFHQGHQLLVETALAETDSVVVVIYNCPETTIVPLSVRARWIRDIYPNVEVIEAWDGPLIVGNTPEIRKLHEDYLLQKLAGRKMTHFYSSEFYGEHISRALGAVNRVVDAGRSRLPISGSLLRHDPAAHRHFLHPRVYRDLIVNIVFLGAPATGKTTLAKALAEEFQTQWMPEYGREYWEQYQTDRRLGLEQLVEIAAGHLEREEALLTQSNRYLFTDTNALTTYLFSLYYHGAAHPRLVEYANVASRRYDLVFLCDDDIPYDNTWDRSGEGNRHVFQQMTLSELAERKIPHLLLRGSLDHRMDQVRQVLSRFKKYANLLELYT